MLIKSTLNKKKHIGEAKKRYYTYNKLYYIIENYTYFNFFTKNLINNLKYIKYLFFLNKNFNINIIKLFLLTINLNKRVNQKTHNNIKSIIQIKKVTNLIFLKLLNISFSKSFKIFIENTINYSLPYYKTPIISFDNFLITFLNNNYKLFEHTNIYLIRYKLLKALYKEENILFTYLKTNNHFFFYLLKLTSLTLIKTLPLKDLNTIITLYRNNLIILLLKLNYIKKLKNEYFYCLKIS